MKEIKLFYSKEYCCACGACLNICPKQAITMELDEDGFPYPVIDKDKCIACGRCNKVCAFSLKSGNDINYPRKVYAAATKNININKKSASGGIFAELALNVLSQGGIVFGAAWKDDFSVEHIYINSSDELYKLQGSKYVQSNIGQTYKQAREMLIAGKIVLFSGTPCQISGLKNFLGKDYSNLYTVDIICHGVSNDIFLKDDIYYMLEKNNLPKCGAKVSFRTKDNGWGTSGSIVSGSKRILYDSIRSPYYYYFLQCSIYRDSCYNCHYATEKRTGDITLGDYWGIETAIPDVERVIKTKDGVSCLLVNTEKGETLLQQTSSQLNTILSNLDDAKKRNGQLSFCCRKPRNREVILNIYKEKGYGGVIQYWKRTEKKARLILRLKNLIPSSLKVALKKLR